MKEQVCGSSFLRGPFLSSLRGAKRQGISETALETKLRPRSDSQPVARSEATKQSRVSGGLLRLLRQTKSEARSDTLFLGRKARLLRKQNGDLAVTGWGSPRSTLSLSLRGFLFCHRKERSDEAVQNFHEWRKRETASETKPRPRSDKVGDHRTPFLSLQAKRSSPALRLLRQTKSEARNDFPQVITKGKAPKQSSVISSPLRAKRSNLKRLLRGRYYNPRNVLCSKSSPLRQSPFSVLRNGDYGEPAP